MTTLVPTGQRRELADDVELGGGNAFERAVAIAPAPDLPYLTTTEAVPGADGLPRREFSLRQLDELAARWAGGYVARGVRPRDRVGVYVRDGLDDLLQYLALTRIGAIPVLINGRMAVETAARHCERTGVVGVHTDAEHVRTLHGRLDVPWIRVAGEVDIAGVDPVSSRYRHAADDPVLICHSSGTTGVPKAVIWTHAQSMAGVRAHLTRFPDTPDSVILSALPQSHASAVGYLMLGVLAGVPMVVVSDPAPDVLAGAAARHRATMVVAFAGAHAAVARTPSTHDRFGTVQRWVSVGDAAHHTHIDRLTRLGRHRQGDRWVPGSLFVDGFGSSELGWGGVLSRVIAAGTRERDRCIGRPQPHADVTVLRPDGTEADPHQVGLLAVRGPTVTPGYWNDSDATYRSRLAGRWLSGDLVYRDEHDRFYHVDRTADVIRTDAGEAYSVLMEEVLLRALPELDEVAVVGSVVDGRIVPVSTVRLRDGGQADGLLARANAALAENGQPPLASVVVDDGDRIPVGVTGKVLKRVLRKTGEN